MFLNAEFGNNLVYFHLVHYHKPLCIYLLIGYSSLMHFPLAIMLIFRFISLLLIFAHQRRTFSMKSHQIVTLMLVFQGGKSDSFYGKMHLYWKMSKWRNSRIKKWWTSNNFNYMYFLQMIIQMLHLLWKSQIVFSNICSAFWYEMPQCNYRVHTASIGTILQ